MRKLTYRRQWKERPVLEGCCNRIEAFKSLNWVTCLIGRMDGSNIARPGDTQQIPHFVCTTPIHSNCQRAWEIIPEGGKTGCKYRCASHPSTGSRQPYDLEETRLSGRMRREIQEQQHAGLSQEELQANQRSQIHKANSPPIQKGQNLDTREPLLTTSNCLCRKAKAPWDGEQKISTYIPNAKHF